MSTPVTRPQVETHRTGSGPQRSWELRQWNRLWVAAIVCGLSYEAMALIGNPNARAEAAPGSALRVRSVEIGGSNRSPSAPVESARRQLEAELRESRRLSAAIAQMANAVTLEGPRDEPTEGSDALAETLRWRADGPRWKPWISETLDESIAAMQMRQALALSEGR